MTKLVVKTYAELEKINPFRRPDWRWERVMAICDRSPTPGRCTRRDDRYIRTARNFWLRYRTCQTEQDRRILAVEYPGLYLGYRFHEMAQEHVDSALIIESRLLARQSFETIAAEDGTHPEAVEWYERLFFNVTDRLGCNDYILKHVLLPCVGRGYATAHAPTTSSPWDSKPCAAPYGDMTLKFFAYYGGQHAVDVLLSGFKRGTPVVSADQFDKWMEKQWATNLKRRTAMAGLTFEVDKFNVTELFVINTRLIEIANAAANSEQAESFAEQHIMAFLKATPWARAWIDSYQPGQTLLKHYDEGDVELRDDEVQHAAAGELTGPLQGLDIIELPPAQRSHEIVPVSKESKE